MSKVTDSNQTNEPFPDIQRLREIMQVRSTENKKVVESRKVEFEKNINQASNRSGSTIVYVNVPTDKLKWGDTDEKFIPWHWIHYGFPKKGTKKWTVRDLKSWENNESEMVFRKLQKLCYDNGYYLYDISNPEKGNKTFLKISIEQILKLNIFLALKMMIQNL